MGLDPLAMAYQSPGWFDSLCAAGRHADESRLYRVSDGSVYLVPLACARGVPRALSVAGSLPPGWGIGGIIGSAPLDVAILRAILADLARLPFASLRIRPNPLQAAVWSAAMPKGAFSVPRRAHVLDLGGGFDRVWNERFDRRTRSRVRRAEASGVEIRSDDTGRLVPVFYRLLSKSFDRWAAKQNEPRLVARLRRTRQEPLAKLETIARTMGTSCTVWIASVDGEPAAGSVVLHHGNVNDSRGAIDRDVLGTTGANDLLLKATIEDACRRGCRHYHLGETGTSESLAHFKERFGAVAYDYGEIFLERLPYRRTDAALRRMVKTLIGFRD